MLVQQVKGLRSSSGDSLVDGLEVEGAEEGRVLDLLGRRCCRRVTAGCLAAGGPGGPAPSWWVSGGCGSGWSLALGGTTTGPTTWVWRILNGAGGSQTTGGTTVSNNQQQQSQFTLGPGDWRTR